eukprot:9787845-Lingulodinium_polyedra.AAC.1
MGLTNLYSFLVVDVSIAVLHATLYADKAIFVYDLLRSTVLAVGVDVFGKLLGFLYGLKTSPKDWQGYVVDLSCETVGRARWKIEPN